MDLHYSSPYPMGPKQGENAIHSTQSQNTPPGQMPPMPYQQIPPIHISSSSSLNSTLQASSQTPDSSHLLSEYPNSSISGDVDRKHLDHLPQTASMSRPSPQHYMLPSRSQYQGSHFLPASNVYPMGPNSPYSAQPSNTAQYFPRLNEPTRLVSQGSQGYSDAQLHQQILAWRSSRQLQSQYPYVPSNLVSNPPVRSKVYPASNAHSSSYGPNIYSPHSDTQAVYGSRESIGVADGGSQLPNYAPSGQRATHSLPQNRVEQPAAASDGSTETNFKPIQTKKNSRPKINKLESDYKYSQGSSEGIHEHSHDKIYENFRSILGIPTPRANISEVYEISLQSPLEKKLFDLFCKEIAVFIDIFLTYDYFEKIVSELAIYDNTRMMLDSLLSLSSLIFQRKYPQEIDPWCPLKYYQRSVNSIRHNLSLPEIDNPESGLLARCLISTNILCIYELFFIAIDSTYVKGAGSILMSVLSRGSATKSLLKDSQFYQACFWATYVCDLILSLKLELPNMFSTTELWKPLDPIYFSTFDHYPNEDFHSNKQTENYSSYIVSKERTIWWSNKIMLLCGEINDFSTSSDVITLKDYEMNTRYYTWLQLNAKLNEYVKHMPVFLKPLVHKPAQHESEFPTIYYDDERTAIIGINLKISKILLYFACEKLRIKDEALIKPEMHKYPPDYGEKLAKDIAGIMQTYDCSRKVWPVSIHSLRQASKFIHPKSLCHNNMKKLVTKVIQVCQTRSQILTS